MTKIPVSIINNVPFIFDADDYMTLRTDHRIVGNITGIPTSYPRNIHLNGLPAILNLYELKLLLEKNLVVLLEKIGLQNCPNEEETKEYQEQRSKQLEPQIEDYVEKRLETTKKIINKIVDGKKKKLLKSGAPEDEIKKITPDDVLQEEAKRLRESIAGNLLVQIPTEHPIPVETKILETIDFSGMDDTKYKVFRDLWTRGKYVTPGDSFGCDFLVYPGDPLFYHASHKIHIVQKDEKLEPKELVTHVRLSNTVNKHCTFVFEDDAGELVYQTMSWFNFEMKTPN